MFGINGFEFIGLAVLALLLLGPDKLPGYASEAARIVRQVRRMAANAQDEVRREMGPEFKDISVQNLNPRTFVSKHLLDDSLDDFTDLGLDDDEPPVSRRRNGAAYARRDRAGSDTGAAQEPPPEAPRPPYDADAT